MFKNKGFSAVALIIILAVLIGGGYAVWKKPVATPPSALPEGEGIENWKTYRNEEYGFEFKYPPEWRETLFEGCGPIFSVSADDSQTDRYYMGTCWACEDYFLSFEKVDSGEKLLSSRDVSVNNHSTKRLEFQRLHASGEYYEVQYLIDVSPNDLEKVNMFFRLFYLPQDYKESIPVKQFEQVVSTFRFTK